MDFLNNLNPETIIIIAILIFSIIIHEISHGYAALFLGDKTAEKAGRLTLNPIPHLDPIGSVLLPAFLYSLLVLFSLDMQSPCLIILKIYATKNEEMQK